MVHFLVHFICSVHLYLRIHGPLVKLSPHCGHAPVYIMIYGRKVQSGFYYIHKRKKLQRISVIRKFYCKIEQVFIQLIILQFKEINLDLLP